MSVDASQSTSTMPISNGLYEHQQPDQILQLLSISTVYDADPRPTFIIDTIAGRSGTKLGISYSNPALLERRDLQSCLDDAWNVNVGFGSWATSGRDDEHYYRYGGCLWFAFTVHERWKVVSTISSYSSIEADDGRPMTPSHVQFPKPLGDGYAWYEATISRLKEEIRICECGRKQAVKEKQSQWEAVQRLKEDIRSLESTTPRSGLSRVASRESLRSATKQPSQESHSPDAPHDHFHSELHSHAVNQLNEDDGKSLSPSPFESRRILPVRTVTASDDAGALLALDKFQRLAEAVDVGFFDYDLSGRLLHANDSWYALSGHPREPEQHTTLSFKKCVYPDDEELVLKQWTKLLKGQPVTFEMRWRKPAPPEAGPDAPDGAQWVLSACVPVYGEDGELKSISGCTTDISAQKQSAEVALQRAEALERARASEERFARFAEVAPIAIFRFDRQKNIEYCNDRWFEMTGIARCRFEEIQWPFGVYEEDVERCSQAWERSTIDRAIGQIEFRLCKEWQDSRGRRGQAWVWCTFFPEFSEDGSFNGLMGSLLDISHIKWAENMQRLRAEEALKAKRQQENFIDITSHEMRNPLSAMVQCADSIVTSLTEISKIELRNRPSRGVDETGFLKEQIDVGLDSVQTILLCAAHQKRIVDDILTLSKLDSNLLLVTPVATDPIIMVQAVLKMFDMDCTKSDLQLDHVLDQSYQDLNAQWVMLDPSRVSQVLINLLGNAIKFTKSEITRKVTVRMSASLDPPSRDDEAIHYIPAESAVDDLGSGFEAIAGEPIYLKFEVQDTGRGLTREEKEKLFMRFSQASPKTHVEYGGSGLGLFISRKLTEMQGGEIGFASEADIGSTFAFYIKTKRTSPPADEVLNPRKSMSNERRPSKRSLKRNLSVLLVEDNLVNQKVLSKQLEGQGCTVFVAGHGGEALEFIKTTEIWSKGLSSKSSLSLPEGGTITPICEPVSIDIVLMDIEMPVMGGLECTQKIREFEAQHLITEHLPIISISANARQEQVNEAMLAGVDDTITKPFRIKELMPKLNRLASLYE